MKQKKTIAAASRHPTMWVLLLSLFIVVGSILWWPKTVHARAGSGFITPSPALVDIYSREGIICIVKRDAPNFQHILRMDDVPQHDNVTWLQAYSTLGGSFSAKCLWKIKKAYLHFDPPIQGVVNVAVYTAQTEKDEPSTKRFLWGNTQTGQSTGERNMGVRVDALPPGVKVIQKPNLQADWWREIHNLNQDQIGAIQRVLGIE